VENLEYISVLIIALSLSADCLAVAISGSIALVTATPSQILRTSLSFGLFQALMAWLGWLIGHTIVDAVSNYDHWLAFILLLLVGSRMIWESVKKKEKTNIDISKGYLLLVLSLATSIDALAVGLSFAFIQVNIVSAVTTIGIVAFLVTAVGFIIGKRLGTLIGKRAELIGGLILIAIGFRILLSHML
jgi:putative Mn2+ efflux pump MntP